MLSRRAFLSALAVLPFVGKMIPQAQQPPNFYADIKVGPALYPTPGVQAFPVALRPLDDNATMRNLGRYLQFTTENAWREASKQQPLTFAEWDQRHQG